MYCKNPVETSGMVIEDSKNEFNEERQESAKENTGNANNSNYSNNLISVCY